MRENKSVGLSNAPHPSIGHAGKSIAVLWLLSGLVLVGLPPLACGADALVDAAVSALSQLTDPVRLATLPDDNAVLAQLGPALGWIHVARRHDVSPESVIARAFQRNGLAGEAARVTRESLLRNLARADAWELFNHPESARALAYGRPAPIPVGMHHGRLARAVLATFEAGVFLEAQRPPEGWDFGSLNLRADDEPPPRPVPGHRRNRQRTDHVSSGSGSVPTAKKSTTRSKREVSRLLPPPIIYDEPLPVPDP